MKINCKDRDAHLSVNLERFGFSRWGYLLASGILAGCFAMIVYSVFDFPQQYSQLIVGNLAWIYSNKFHDYALLFGFVMSFLVFFIFISAMAERFKRIGNEAEILFHEFIILLSAPVGFWFAGLLTIKSDSLFLVEMSGILITASLVISFLLLLKFNHIEEMSVSKLFRTLQTMLLIFVASGLSIVAIGIALNRVSSMMNGEFWISSRFVITLISLIFTLQWVAMLLLIFKSRSLEAMALFLRKALYFLQIMFPFFYLLLIPTPWIDGKKLFVGYPLGAIGYWIIGALIIGAFFDLYRRHRLTEVSSDISPLDLFSSMCAIAVLLFIKVNSIYEPSISADDYHVGEMIVPWWSFVKQHMVPFWDYCPARGLINYFQGAINDILFDGKASSFPAGVPFMYAAVFLITLPILRWCLGLGIAALSLLLMSGINGLSEIDIFVTVFLCISIQGFLTWQPVRWIGLWILSGLVMLLLAPGQGALSILATSPLGLYKLHQSWNGNRKELLYLFSAFTVVALPAFFITPMGKMLYGAIRYGFEQSSVNSIANGISWNNSFGFSNVNSWLFEMVRSSWILVALFAGILILQMRSPKLQSIRNRILVYAVPIFLLTIFFIIRAAGRIDCNVSRLGYASVWELSMLLPLLLFATHRYVPNGKIIFFWVTMTGLISPYFWGVIKNIDTLQPFQPPPLFAAAVNGAAVGMPEIGTAIMDPGHLARLIEIRKILDTVLDPDETYLDLTGRHATYFYFNRRPPVESGSIYNLVTEPQQLRAVIAIKKNPPPAILISADNILHDGGPASLRANLLYRSLLLMPGYKVVKTGSLIWMLRADRVGRISGMDVESVSDVNDLPSNILNTVFRVPDLRWIPASWGRSSAALEKTMHVVYGSSSVKPAGSHSVSGQPNGYYRIDGNRSSLRFDISGFIVKGSEAGLLSFDFTIEPSSAVPVIKIYWSSPDYPESKLAATSFYGSNGRLIVPMDSIPAWLLAPHIISIRFELGNCPPGCVFKLENIRFYQRNAAL